MFTLVGGDGTVSIWDHTAKEWPQQYLKYVLRVQDIAFNVDRSQLTVGVTVRRPRSYFLAGGVVMAWARMRSSEVRGCGDSERGDSECRGGQRWAEGAPAKNSWQPAAKVDSS